MKYKILSAVVLICMSFMLVSCGNFSIGTRSERKYEPRAGRKYERKHGPPPHAPAHGYRHKYQSVELVYDSGRGVYVVIDFPNHYYFKGHYYRLGEIQWEVGVSFEGPWKIISYEKLPKGLRVEKKGKGKAKGKSKGNRGRGLGLDKE